MKKRVVVTGLGVVSSLGIGKDEFWNNLIAGKSGISEVTIFDTSKHVTHMGGEVKDFNPKNFMDKRRIQMTGRASQLAIAAAKLAVEDSGLDGKMLNDFKCGVCMGTTMGEIQAIENIDHRLTKLSLSSGESKEFPVSAIRNFHEKSDYKQSAVKFLVESSSKTAISDLPVSAGGNSLTFPKNIDRFSTYQSPPYNISSNVAIELGLKGRNSIFTTACAAGNYAIGYGYDLLQFGEADIVFAGGSDAFSWIAFTGFNKVGATSPQKCQPFDKNRKGMIPGEGAGILVLETLTQAKKRNAPIYAEVLGYGLSCDASHMTNPHVDGVTACLRNALVSSHVKPRDVDYVCAHGTGTIFNDRVESAAIRNIFGSQKIAVSSIKSMLGHTLGAASAIAALSSCLALVHDIIPPTINYETPDPECNIDCVPNTARNQTVNIVLNNGFAFGGNNSCLVLKKWIN